MICKKCGKEFTSLFSAICPYCGKDNDEIKGFFDLLFDKTPDQKPKKKDTFDPYDWNNPDNCSDREYMDDDDYDDFDN